MWLILLAGFLIPFICFGYLISKLDIFLAENYMEINNDNVSHTAVILGETDLAKHIAELLEKDGIHVMLINEPFLLERGKSFRYLFALSEKDADNLVLCKIGEKIYGIEEIISICNDRKNEGMFISEKIDYILNEAATPELLYKNVRKKLEVE